MRYEAQLALIEVRRLSGDTSWDTGAPTVYTSGVDPVGTVRRNTLVKQSNRMHEHTLFSVMGQKLTGHAMALIIADLEADAEYYALHELGFVALSDTTLVSDSVYVESDTRE
jgi:hypothetical protein